jgi:HAD superfamily hydrolase (TIGR01509 family)
VKSFLESRDIDLPFGTPEDEPKLETVCGLGNRKNEAFNEVLKNEGVVVYPSTVALLEELQKAGIRIGVASSSKNCEAVLKAAGLTHFVETRVDGVVSAETGLNGKPAPDIFVTAAANLGVDPNKSVVVEDASSGVAAGKNGNFGLVLGLAREDNTQALLANGADVVVDDLEDFGMKEIDEWFEKGIEQDNWQLNYYDYNPEKEKSREALLTVGNGYFGTRGAMEECRIGEYNYPGTYIAGLYNRLLTPIAGRDVENEDFVNAPNWLKINFKIEDENWFDPNDVTINKISRKLDFRNGLLTKTMLVTDGEGRQTKLESFRMASMANMHLAAIKYRITPLNYSASMSFCSSLDGTHKNEGVKRYNTLNQRHLEPMEQGGEGNTSFLKVRTTQSKIEIVETARLQFRVNGKNKAIEYGVSTDDGIVYTLADYEALAGETIEIEKVVSIHTSQSGEKEILKQTAENIANAGNFDALLKDSSDEWEKIWQEADIQIEGDRISQKLLRMHIYHLMVSASKHNENLDASVTARGLHGEAYRGHIFWDELFILPYYDIHFPKVAKSLLMYRYNRLDKARKYAAKHNFEGAMYPWQSGSTGREETQVVHLNPLTGDWGVDHSSLQRHVSLAIAYNIWQYFHMTEDAEFVENYGAEMFLEICRFWASKSSFDTTTAKYSIEGVMGPDEFHESYPNKKKGGLKDNAYTNIMVAWMYARIPELLEKMSEPAKASLFERIDLDPEELGEWDDIRSNLALDISEDGIIAQYDGYFDLKELDWGYFQKKYGNVYRMDRLLKAEGKSADDYKVAKQADTLMTFYNLEKSQVDEILKDLNYKVPDNYLEKNLEYYLKRTSHGSTLSRVVHSPLAKMTGNNQLAWDLYFEALTSDYNDIQGGTTAEGIHAGVMAGTVMIALTTFAGIDLRGNVLSITPSLPERWKKMKFGLWFKGVHFQFEVSNEKVLVVANKAAVILIAGKEIFLNKGEPMEIVTH